MGEVQVKVRVSEEVRRALKVKAAQEGTTVQALIDQAIGELLHKESKGGRKDG